MTTINYEELVTPTLVRQLFQDNVVKSDCPKWAIFISGKLISIQGKIFYDSREQAVKAFYNHFSWRAKRRLWNTAHPGDLYHWWGNPEGAVIWKAFKKSLETNYGLTFREV